MYDCLFQKTSQGSFIVRYILGAPQLYRVHYKQWQIQDSPEGGSFSCPKNLMTFFVLNLFIILRFLCPQNLIPFFSHHSLRRAFRFFLKVQKTPNSAPSLQLLLQTNFFVSEGGSYAHNKSPWIQGGLLGDKCVVG